MSRRHLSAPPRPPRPLRRALIAIVGRPNVGKSTLFNRLAHRRRAIVENQPGVTRDRHYADTDLDGRACTVIDTGGFVPLKAGGDPIADLVRTQAQAAVEECDLVLLVVDGRTGLTADDQEVAKYLRKQVRPVVLVVNKLDEPRQEDLALADFFALGLGDPVPVSAEHARGLGGLYERLEALLPPRDQATEEAADEAEAEFAGTGADGEAAAAAPIRVAVVGRPNVGKSTLVNALLKKPRVVVSPVAGTTRDPIDTELTWGGQAFVLTDTAGIRRKSAISQRVEGFSVMGAIRAIEDCDVAVLVLDATEAAVEQDLRIASLAVEKGRALLIVVNKWDLARERWKEESFRGSLKWYLDWVAWAPLVFVTAKTGHKVDKVLEVALELQRQQQFRAPTPLLNRILEHVTTEHPMPVVGGRPLKMYYVAQVAVAPPSFAFVCNQPHGIPDRFQRFVSNWLREALRLKVPVRLFWRERPGKKARAETARRFKARETSRRRR
jgi:GTP-binding protein